MVIGITGSIETEILDKLIRTYNELPDKLDIYLNSEGGDPDIGVAIIDLINNNSEKTKIIGYGKLFSTGFDIFFKSNCKRLLLSGVLGMAHMVALEMKDFSINESSSVSEASNYKKWLEQDKKSRLVDYEKIGLNKKELSKIKSGGDCYFQFNRLLELMNGKLS